MTDVLFSALAAAAGMTTVFGNLDQAAGQDRPACGQLLNASVDHTLDEGGMVRDIHGHTPTGPSPGWVHKGIRKCGTTYPKSATKGLLRQKILQLGLPDRPNINRKYVRDTGLACRGKVREKSGFSELDTPIP